MLSDPMNFQHLKTFCTVLQEKSMTAASQKLFLTQPAVSQQIRHLEEEIGVDLLVRGVRQVKPTAQGQLLFDYAHRILNMVEQAKIAIQTVGAEVSGTLRVGTLNSVGLHLIGPVFALFLKNNDSVRLNLKYGNGIEMLDLLEEGHIDVAILPETKTEYGSAPEDCESEPIYQDELCLVASAKDRSVPKQIQLKDINLRPIIQLSQEYPNFERMIAKELKSNGVNVRPVFESANVGTLKRVIESGLGWGFLPLHSVRKQLDTGRLQRLEVTDFRYQVNLHCYFPKGNTRSKTTEVFIKALQQQQS